jgi:DNA-binding response OmpR family regulator
MEGVDGIQAVKKLKQNEATSKIPIIMLTALTYAETVSQAMEAGAIDYIAKPFEPKVLLEKVRKVLK